MSNNKPIKGPGRGGAAFRSGPMVENPGKMLGRLLAYVFKNYKIHIIAVVIGIVVSVLANVQGTMFTQDSDRPVHYASSEVQDIRISHPLCNGNFACRHVFMLIGA